MHQIRYFLAVSRTLNFTRAADDCHVAQPSLTRAIKLLEAELGGDLFRRERNLTHLADFGQRMLPPLRQCYESALAAKSLALSIKTGSVASLTLALSHTVSITVVVDPLSELMRVFPTLELRFLRGTAAEIGEYLKKGDAALAIAGPLGETWERLDMWPLFTEGFQAVVSPAHRLAGAERASLKDLACDRLLARPYCELAGPLAECFREHDISWKGRCEMICEHDLMQLVDAGLGVAIVPKSALCPRGLRRLDIDGVEIMRTVALYGVAGRERPAPAAALLKLLRARDWSPEPN
jgi:DNA-binding transcriptional LysR family regulator